MDLKNIPKEVYDKWSPESKVEVGLLMSIDALLTRVKDISGDEAYVYVQAKNYLKIKVEDIIRREEFIAKAMAAQVKKDAEAKAVSEALPPTTPALTVVKNDPEPPKA